MSVGGLLALAATVATALGQDGRKLTAEADRRLELDLQHYYPAKKLQLTLSALATAYSDLVRVESIGKSRGGEAISVVTIARVNDVDPRDRPGLLVVGCIGREDLFGAELALATIWQIAQDNARDAAVARVLDGCTLYIVPCLDPDLRERAFAEIEGGAATDPSPRVAELDRNFPSLWDPLRISGTGPYPLSEPEARALAEFLVARANIAVVQRYRGAGARAASVSTQWPVADREAHRRLAAEGLLDGLEALEGGEGSWLAFAYLQHGAFVFSQPVSFQSSGPWLLPSVLELQGLGRTAASATLRLAQALPRIELTTGSPESLGDGQWSVDVEISNAGRLPTASALGRERVACDPPRLSIEGAKLIGTAVVRDGIAEPVACEPALVALDEIAGAAQLRLRLFVSAPSEATLTLTVVAPRAGRASASVLVR